MAEAILPPEHVPSMYRQAVGAQTESATPCGVKGLRSKNLVAGAGFEPTPRPSAALTEPQHKDTKPAQNHNLADSEQQLPEQKTTLSEEEKLRFQTPPGCTQGVPESSLPADLAQVVEAWGRLPEAVKADILAMVNAARPQEGHP